MNSASPSPARQAYLLANRRQNRQVHLWQIALLLGLLALWELSCRMGLSDGFLTSCPSRMAATFWSLCRSGQLLHHIGVSCLETVLGFTAGTLLGTAAAILLLVFFLYMLLRKNRYDDNRLTQKVKVGA